MDVLVMLNRCSMLRVIFSIHPASVFGLEAIRKCTVLSASDSYSLIFWIQNAIRNVS